MNKIFIMVVFAVLTGWSEPTAFLNVPEFIGVPDAQRSVTNRAVTMVPSMAVTPGGRLWATWYAGYSGGEGPNNYVVLSTSGDNGKTWQEALVIDPDWTGPVRTFDPEVWMAPDGSLYCFWAQSVGHNGTVAGVWALKVTNPEEALPACDAPQRLTDGVMMCKPVVLSTGEWVLPASTWRWTDSSARMMVSSDQGKTWTLRGACHVPKDVRAFDEHMIVERKDGSLWMLVRASYGIGESISTDRGVTWPELVPSQIPHPSARFFISRLNSGNLLLVKHGSMDERIGRSHLMAFISTDDGKSWGGGLLLDERGGISYPDGQQTADGTIYITYDYSRTGEKEILFATFKEEDAATAENVSGTVSLRQLVSKGSGGVVREPKAQTLKEVKSNSDGVELNKILSGSFAVNGVESDALSVGKRLFTDRGYVVAEVPDALQDATFLRIPLNDAKTLVCEKPGVLWLLTPLPMRNRDSQAAELEAQGFQKTNLPEIRLFDRSNPANFSSLYQKMCTANEEIQVGKWAVPLFFTEQL